MPAAVRSLSPGVPGDIRSQRHRFVCDLCSRQQFRLLSKNYFPRPWYLNFIFPAKLYFSRSHVVRILKSVLGSRWFYEMHFYIVDEFIIHGLKYSRKYMHLLPYSQILCSEQIALKKKLICFIIYRYFFFFLNPPQIKSSNCWKCKEISLLAG